jgi:hypothetical protein
MGAAEPRDYLRDYLRDYPRDYLRDYPRDRPANHFDHTPPERVYPSEHRCSASVCHIDYIG